MRYAVYGLLLLLYVLHTDVWYWNDPRSVLGLPIGVTYHVLWTLAVTAVFGLAVAYAWPAELETDEPAPPGGPSVTGGPDNGEAAAP